MRPSACVAFMVEQPPPCLLISVEFLMVVIPDGAGTGCLLGEVGESLACHSIARWSYSGGSGEEA